MSLKSIRESYSKLLTVFNDAGVKLTEAQKADLDTFVLALESTMSKQRQEAIRKTKLAVEAKLDKEYTAEFKKLMESIAENQKLSSKVQNKIAKINESKKLAVQVNDFLDLYVESVLPKKTIIDYDRMQKLEAIHESLKDVLLLNDDAVAQKKAQLEESFKHEKSKCETEVAKMQVKLNESMAKAQQLKRKIDQFKALELLESKTKDLPTFEARAVKKRLATATAPEIEKQFDRVLESVQAEAKKAEEEAETTLESEIDKIVDSEGDQLQEGEGCGKLKEDDLLRGRVHNGHLDEAESDFHEYELEFDFNDGTGSGNKTDKVEATSLDDAISKLEANGYGSITKVYFATEDGKEIPVEEDFETTEEVNMDANGDVNLEESEVIDPGLMKMWCAKSIEVY